MNHRIANISLIVQYKYRFHIVKSNSVKMQSIGKVLIDHKVTFLFYRKFIEDSKNILFVAEGRGISFLNHLGCRK